MKNKNGLDKLYLNMALNKLYLLNSNLNSISLTHNSLLYLDLIYQNTNCTVSLLAKALGVTKSAVTLKIKEFERQGLIEKIQSSEDKRIFYLSLKDEIASIYKQSEHNFENIIEELRKKFKKKDINNFFDVLKAFNKNIAYDKIDE